MKKTLIALVAGVALIAGSAYLITTDDQLLPVEARSAEVVDDQWFPTEARFAEVDDQWFPTEARFAQTVYDDELLPTEARFA